MKTKEKKLEKTQSTNFIRQIIEKDLKDNKVKHIITRFPPEPNGYLHFGHAKSICLNFGIAKEYGGRCHLRFDDTNPEKENEEFVQSIMTSVNWLGFDWGNHLYFASDYFEKFYQFALKLIENDYAYVDSQSYEEIKSKRGTLKKGGINSPYRGRTVAENLELFEKMKNGKFPDGAQVLRAKIDMKSPNLNLRDPILYRVRHVTHHRQGSKWCIYPLYDFAHPLSDAIENITHSICTLEFEDHRPLYDWVVNRVAECGFFNSATLPRQYEFSRLSVSNVFLSKRKLGELIQNKYVEGWDDPRMPTIAGAKKRGYTPKGFINFCEAIGVTKSDAKIDYSVFEECMREDLNLTSQRRIAVLKPIKLIIENVETDFIETCHAPNHPKKPELGKRKINFTKELYIDSDDFQENPVTGFFRLQPGGRVRLRYAYVVECTGFKKDKDGKIIYVKAKIFSDSKSGTPGANNYKVKGNIHWVSAQDACSVQINFYERLFEESKIDENSCNTDLQKTQDVILNQESHLKINSITEASILSAKVGEKFQFERHGYFVLDEILENKIRVFNRTVSLKDNWQKR